MQTSPQFSVSLEQFFATISRDEPLKEKLKNVSSIDGLITLGKEYGYIFTTEDLKTLSAAVAAIKSIWRDEVTARAKEVDRSLAPPNLSGIITLTPGVA